MNPHKFNYESMGTHWEITIWDKLSKKKLSQLEEKITRDSNSFDKTYSRFKVNSLVTKISGQKGVIKVPRDFTKMLELYFDLYKLSEKTISPLVGQALSEMGYDPAYSMIASGKIKKVPDLIRSVSIIDSAHINAKKPLLFDFGALGKGYFVDKIAGYLIKEEVKRFLVNGSGDIYYQGEQSIKVGLEHPLDATKVIGSIEMTTGAMCASAGNRRKWGKVHHIINPNTLKPARDITATWVLSDTTALSDALSTCLFFVAPENFEKKYKFEYLILNREMRVKRSKGFNAELY